MTTALKNSKQKKKDVMTLGHVHEIHPVNFIDMGLEAQGFITQIHIIALEELMNRSVISVWCWSRRVENIFKNNHINTVRDLTIITLQEVNRLPSCGFKSRREIYDIFLKEYNIKLNQWNPEHHWDKYVFNPSTMPKEE